jgi:hypothetical protein
VDDIAIGIANDNILQVDGTLEDNDFCYATANGIEGKTAAETAALLTTLLPKQMAENDPLLLDAAISGDGYYSGICEVGTAGTVLVFGNLVYLAVADSKWELADANTLALANAKLGICVLAAAENAATTILLWGKVNAASLYPALTIGAKVYVGETAGNIQVAAPTGDTDVIRCIGYANTADELFFCPAPDNTAIIDDTAGGNDAAIYKGTSANAFYDHGVATTGVHGTGALYVAKSTTDGLDMSAHKSRHEFGGADEVDPTAFTLLKSPPFYYKDWRNLDGISSAISGTGSVGAVPSAIGIVLTGATNGSEACLYHASLYQGAFRFKFRGYFNSVTTTCTVWIGMMSDVTAPADISKHIVFRIINGTVYGECGDGAAYTRSASLGTFDSDKIYSFRSDGGGSTKFYGDGTLLATISTNNPAADSHYPALYIINSAASDRQFAILPFMFTQG